jgi:hypothetical protein
MTSHNTEGIPRNKAEEYYAGMIGPERERLVRLLSSGTCHVAVVQGPNVLKGWLELIEECGLDRRTDTMLMHSSLSTAAADAEARFFFHAWNRPTWKFAPLPGSDAERLAADQVPGELCGQSALWQWEKNGWFFMVHVRDHVVDDMYAVGDAAETVSCVSTAALLFESEWECPMRVGEVLLAQHPFHPESYAPAVLLELTNREFEFKVPLLTVEFYDGLLADVPQDRCVLLSADLVDYDKLVSAVEAAEQVQCAFSDRIYTRGCHWIPRMFA